MCVYKYMRGEQQPSLPSLLLTTALSPRLRFAPRSGTLQQPGDVFVHNERDARAGKHPDDVRGQAAVEPRDAFMRPGVRDGGRDGAVVRAREDRVILIRVS